MRLFGALDGDELTPTESEYIRDAEASFAALSAVYKRLAASPKRLKVAKEFPLPLLGAPYELVTVYALRALELAEGAAALIERRNEAAAFPFLRSLYELWAAVLFAKRKVFECLIEKDDWDQFDSIAMRLLLGTRGYEREPHAINVAEMIRAAETEFNEIAERGGGGGDELARQHKQVYAELSNGTHPTQWGIIGHAEVRSDGLGVVWHRKPLSDSRAPHLADLALTLKLLRRWLDELEQLAEEVAASVNSADASSSDRRRALAAQLRHLLQTPEIELAPESRGRIEHVATELERSAEDPPPR